MGQQSDLDRVISDLRYGDLPRGEVIAALDDEGLGDLIKKLSAELKRLQGLIEAAKLPGTNTPRHWFKHTCAEQLYLAGQRTAAKELLKERRARVADRRELAHLRAPTLPPPDTPAKGA